MVGGAPRDMSTTPAATARTATNPVTSAHPTAAVVVTPPTAAAVAPFCCDDDDDDDASG
jgi:hypothetical protein